MTVQIMPHYYTGKPALTIIDGHSEMELERLNELIALLSEARRLIVERGA